MKIYLKTAINSGLLALASTTALASEFGSTGFVEEIIRAPVVADGDVSGQPADFVINFDRSLDPSVKGRVLEAGGSIRVTFPEGFDLTDLGDFPLGDVFVSNDCGPGNLQCTTALLLQGFPQAPVPPPPFYRLSIDQTANALVFNAISDVDFGAGIKQIHLILNGVENPRPGRYRLHVEFRRNATAAPEVGSGEIRIRRRARRGIYPTGVFAQGLANGGCEPSPPPSPNTLYQATEINTAAPWPWTFLLWGDDAVPLDQVTVTWVTKRLGFLKRRGRPLGRIEVLAPLGGENFEITQDVYPCPSRLEAAPVIGATPGIGPQPVGRLDLFFKAGSVPGVYAARVRLYGGESVEHIVEVTR